MLLDVLVTLLVLLLVFVIVRYAITVLLPLDPGLQQLVLTVLGLIFLLWLVGILAGYTTPLHPWRSR